jgi:hypothetical protein
MLVLAAAIVASATSFTPRSGATAQASATVRIVSAARISFTAAQQPSDQPSPRDTTISTDAGPKPARLIEFQ